MRDGWIVYQRFAHAFHQTCLAHLLRRCREMLEVARPGAAELPRTVKEILQASLQLRDRRDQNQISERGLAIARGQLEARLDRTLDRSYRSPTNRRFANHLRQGTGGDVHLPLLPGVGGDELPGRTSHSSHGSHSQGLGRQSYRKWRTYPERIGQYPTDLPSAAPTSDRILGTIAPSAHTPSLGLDPARSPLNKYIFPFERPRRMYRNGRPIVDDFLPAERLYRRFKRNELVNGTLVAAALSFPNTGEDTGQSVNRSRFSRPQDVLWKDEEETRYEGCGVVRFSVSCLPEELICSQTKLRYTFFPRHRPLQRNYAHSEIWCDTLPPSNSRYVKPTSLVRKELRAIICQNITVVRRAAA